MFQFGNKIRHQTGLVRSSYITVDLVQNSFEFEAIPELLRRGELEMLPDDTNVIFFLYRLRKFRSSQVIMHGYSHSTWSK